jgi:hypothetical protein
MRLSRERCDLAYTWNMPSVTRVELLRLDPERVRTRLELGMVKRLQRALGAGWRVEAPSYERTSAALEVDAWLGSIAVESRVRAIVDEARRVLGVDREVEVHATDARLAAAHRTDSGPLILSLHWCGLASLDDDALLAVIGHELGHHLAHNGVRRDGPDPYLVHWRLHADRSSEVRETAAAYSRGAELTADRFALLACQDLDALLRLFAALSTEASARVSTSAFLAVSKARSEDLLANKQRAKGDSHPELLVRAFGAWLFSQSDVYHQLTGRGSGTLSLLDVDMRLAQLVGPDEAAIVPFDEPTWMDGVGEAIYARSGTLEKTIGDRVAKLGAALGGAPAPAPPRREEIDEDEESDLDEPELDDLEARFAALERRMRAGG